MSQMTQLQEAGDATVGEDEIWYFDTNLSIT